MITLKDVASECGVSVSTVSRALNETEQIRPELVKTIRATAERMGYRPNEIARSLKLRRSGVIGILYETAMDHPFFSGVLEALRRSAEKRDYEVMLFSQRHRSGRADSTDTALSRRVDGMIVLYADIREDSLDRLMRNRVPVVSVEDCNRPCPIVTSDYENGTRLLTLEAVRRSHRRVAFLHGEGGVSTARRMEGFRAAMASAGLRGELIPSRFHAGESSAHLILERLRQPDPPDCFLMPDDTSALTAISTLRKRGLSVPEDVGIAGFDGQPWALALAPELSTYRQDYQGIGETAMETLLSMKEEGSGRLRREFLVPGRLIPGETL